MKDWTLTPAIALALLALWPGELGAGAASASAASGPAGVSYAPVGGPASVPYGWADFCRRYAGECDGGPLAPLDVNLTPQAMKEIERVDKWVNAQSNRCRTWNIGASSTNGTTRPTEGAIARTTRFSSARSSWRKASRVKPC
jgi:Bacterial transglutaminase-like cysteine proteinase BTLCP